MTGQAVKKIKCENIYLQWHKSKTFHILTLEWILGVLTLLPLWYIKFHNADKQLLSPFT